jgi:DNA helicase-2/ATP-dependent DNA helicase PcrA
MSEYEKAFKLLNKQQRAAVEQIDGPILVIAGPGTGKTQLLSTRVGYILAKSDALPQNILCLTFTEAGVEAMRERLTGFLGQDAYDVNISTYHAFGSDLIRRYPEYAAMYDFEPIDELGADSLLREILQAAPYSNPLKSADTYARDLRSVISDAKRALLTPDDLEAIVSNNLQFIKEASGAVSRTLQDFTRIGKGSLPLFENLLAELENINDGTRPPVLNLKTLAAEQLKSALEDAASSGKTKEITGWKNTWLAKDNDGGFIFDGRATNQKIAAAAGIYRSYQEEMTKRKLYDYDDMILRAIKALEDHPDFKFTLAEQYLYIMLDEFQDTNAAQMRIVELLTDNPVNEGHPNVLAVGDDDQAIYAFQGAELTNMARFASIYRDVTVISLSDNYRSHKQILDAAHNIGGQIEQRLHSQFKGVDKVLGAANKDLPAVAKTEHHNFISDAAQYAWVASEVKRLIEREGVEANEIAILAPKHKYLIPILPFLAAEHLPLRYEKRENVIDKPVVRMLEQMSRLVVALDARDTGAIDAAWPEVLSYDFWQLPTETIWDISWQADKGSDGWTNLLLKRPETKDLAAFFLRVKDLLSVTNLEQQLDILIGAAADMVEEFELPIRSPFFEYYFGKNNQTDAYLDILSDLSVLRGRLRSWRRGESQPLGLNDFIEFLNNHRLSNINILNSSPHHQAVNAVNVMSAYQAKGREFTAVFLLAVQDEAWGSSSRNQGSTISLPPNLSFMRYRGGSDDERLRLLFVALTRAKTHLYLASYANTLDGKATRPLKYLAGNEGLFKSVEHQDQVLDLRTIESYWHERHTPPFKPKLADLLKPKLDKYQLSPTHLNQFIDVIYGGPEAFFLNSILRFPKGQAPAAQYGTIIHTVLRWIHTTNEQEGKLPEIKRILAFFDEQLGARRLAQRDRELLAERGHRILKTYINLRGDSFNAQDKFEQGFRNEGVFVGDAHLGGNIDKLSFDKKAKTITVYDFKTGPSYDKWVSSNATLHKYKQQLMIYKILIEKSHSYKGWTVDKAVLEFVESPPGEDKIYQLTLEYKDEELKELETLIKAVWKHIKALDFPDVSKYPATMTGIKKFESDLIGS